MTFHFAFFVAALSGSATGFAYHYTTKQPVRMPSAAGEKPKKPAKKTERAKRVTAYNIFVSRRRKQIVEERRKELEKVANDAKSGNSPDSQAPKDADTGGTENKAADGKGICPTVR